jgi:hypothetical protein
MVLWSWLNTSYLLTNRINSDNVLYYLFAWLCPYIYAYNLHDLMNIVKTKV